jgi:hypothetical protein
MVKRSVGSTTDILAQPGSSSVWEGRMDRHDGFGVPSYGRYDEDDRCPICLVPPRAPHMESCDYEGVWYGGDDRDRPSGGHWGG